MSSFAPPTTTILNLSTWIKHLPNQHLTSSSVAQIESIQKACQTLFAICNNILQNPFVEKYRRVRILAPISTNNMSTNPNKKLQYSAPIQQILDASQNPAEMKLFKWFDFLGFSPQHQEENENNNNNSPNQFFEFSTSSSMSNLDLACVEAMKVIDECKNLLQRLEDAKIDGTIQENKLNEIHQKDSQISALQEYRRFAGERKAIENWIDQELSSTTNSAASTQQEDSSSAATIIIWDQNNSMLREVLVSIFEFFANNLNSPERSTIRFTNTNMSLDQSTFANQITSIVEGKLFSSSPSCHLEGLTLIRMSLQSNFQFMGIDPKTGNFSIQKVNSGNNNTVLKIHLESALDHLEKLRHVRVQQFDQLRNNFREKIQSRDAEQQSKVQKDQDAKERPIHIHPELEHTALSLINDISGFMELCWHLEGAVGYVAKHRIESKRLVEEFNLGKIQIQELRNMKEEWEKKYEAMKLAKGIVFFGAQQNPIKNGQKNK